MVNVVLNKSKLLILCANAYGIFRISFKKTYYFELKTLCSVLYRNSWNPIDLRKKIVTLHLNVDQDHLQFRQTFMQMVLFTNTYIWISSAFIKTGIIVENCNFCFWQHFCHIVNKKCVCFFPPQSNTVHSFMDYNFLKHVLATTSPYHSLLTNFISFHFIFRWISQ